MPATRTETTSSNRTTKYFIIGFAVVEALMMTWMLLSGRIH